MTGQIIFIIGFSVFMGLVLLILMPFARRSMREQERERRALANAVAAMAPEHKIDEKSKLAWARFRNALMRGEEIKIPRRYPSDG